MCVGVIDLAVTEGLCGLAEKSAGDTGVCGRSGVKPA